MMRIFWCCMWLTMHTLLWPDCALLFCQGRSPQQCRCLLTNIANTNALIVSAAQLMVLHCRCCSTIPTWCLWTGSWLLPPAASRMLGEVFMELLAYHVCICKVVPALPCYAGIVLQTMDMMSVWIPMMKHTGHLHIDCLASTHMDQCFHGNAVCASECVTCQACSGMMSTASPWLAILK